MDEETQWTSRMEHYLLTGQEHIHWNAILVSIGIILTLAAVIWKMLQRGLSKDNSQYYNR